MEHNNIVVYHHELVENQEIHNVKFPVTPSQRCELRRRAMMMKKERNDISRKYETISNTYILYNAIMELYINPEHLFFIEYVDTGQYMHVSLNKSMYECIFNISLCWNSSVRQTVYRLIMCRLLK